MLGKLLSLAVVLGLVYFVLTQAGPWLGRQMGQTGSSEFKDDGGASYCVELAYSANAQLGDCVRQFGRPPADADAWSSARWDVESAISDASSSCSCRSDACSLAQQALREMQEQLSQIDSLIQGTAAGYGNPARQQERILDLLEEAKSWT